MTKGFWVGVVVFLDWWTHPDRFVALIVSFAVFLMVGSVLSKYLVHTSFDFGFIVIRSVVGGATIVSGLRLLRKLNTAVEK